MANTTKTYYLAPNWDIPPVGPLALGSVLSSVKRPLPPLVIGSVRTTTATTATARVTAGTIDATVSASTAGTASTASTAGATGAPQPQIFSSTKRNFTYTTSSSKSGSAELSVSFLSSVLGVGPTASTNLQRDHSLTLKFSRLDTKEWFPTAEELQAVVQQPSVSQYLRSLRKWAPKQVFVVTGVKIAYGARAETKASHEIKNELEVSIDPGIAGGAPGMVTIGPKVGHGTKMDTDVGWEVGAEGEEDPGLLFAYKVQRIKVKQAKNEDKPVVSHSEYTSGAVHGTGSPSSEEPNPFVIDLTEGDDASENGVFVEADDGSDDLLFIPPSQ